MPPYDCRAGFELPQSAGGLKWQKIEARAIGETWAQAHERFLQLSGRLRLPARFSQDYTFNDGTMFFNFLQLPYATGVAAGRPSVQGVRDRSDRISDVRFFGEPGAAQARPDVHRR